MLPGSTESGARPAPRDRHSGAQREIAPTVSDFPAARDRARETYADVLAGRLGLSSDECGALYGVTGRAWRKWHAAGRVPAPYRLGRAVRWDPRELAEWTRHGCPPRERWDALRGALERRP